MKIISFLFFFLIGSLTQAQIVPEWTINYNDTSIVVSDIDDEENIYQGVTYYQTGIGNGVSIQKYDKNGGLKWSVPFEIENALSYELLDIVIDNNKNVIALIIATEYAEANFYLARYDSSGNQLWIRSDPYSINFSLNYYVSLAVDYNGNIFRLSTGVGSSTGYPFPNPPFEAFLNYLVVKYDSLGAEQWSRTYDGPTSLVDIPRDMVIDETGSVFITGSSAKIDSIDYNNFLLYTSGGASTIKYNSAGILEWVDYFPNALVSDLEIDGSGNVYVVGMNTINTQSNRYEVFLTIKYNTLGSMQWVKTYNPSQSDYYGNLSSVDIDDDGNVFVTGGNLNHRMQTIKYNSSGAEEWNNIIEDVSGTSNKILLSNSGNVFVHGYLRNPGAGYDGGIIKYDTNGSVLWELIENPTRTSDLKLANSGYLYVTRYNQLAKYRDEEVTEEKLPPTNLSYDFDTHSLRWNKSLSSNVYYYQIYKQQYNPWTNTAGEWISVSDSGGNVNKNDSIWVIQTSGFYNYKVGAVFQDTTLFCDSIFVELGYFLRKIENNKVIAYNYQTDQFKLIRNSENWPASWYNQFNYNNPFSYSPIFMFIGTPNQTYCDWPLFTEIIGNDQAYINETLNISNLISIAQWKARSRPIFRGSCAGFSMSSILNFYQDQNYLQQFPYMVNKTPGLIPNTDSDARKVINHLQNTQTFPYPTMFDYEPSDPNSSNANYVLNRLIEIFSNYGNTRLDQYISLTSNDSGLHAVVPIAIRMVSGRPNRYDIQVYDSNDPENIFGVRIQTDKNTWSYIGLLVDSSASGIALKGSITSRLGLLTWKEPENGGGGNGPLNINATERIIYISDSSSVAISINDEVIAGYNISNNSIVSFENSIIEATDGTFNSPKGFIVPNVESKVIFSDQISGSKASVMFQSESKNYYLAERTSNALSGEVETIEIINEGFNYLNTDNINKSINLTAMSETYQNNKFAQLSNITINQNDSLGFWFQNESLNLKNTGGIKNYKVTLINADPNGKSEFINEPVSISANSTHILTPNWADLENDVLLVLIDNNNDGMIDDSLLLPNQYDPLPVELTAFTAKRLHNYVRLDWQTSTEINNYGFEIEKASLKNLGSKVWNKIGFVEGSGNSNSPKNYSYIDKSFSDGVYVYRLKQIDNDGTFSYSDEVEINFNDVPVVYSLDQNYPNPFNPTTIINWQSPIRGHQILKIYDALGNEVATLVDEFREAGRYEIEFDASNLSSGVYFYRLQAGSFVETKKMILLR